ncbi:uncharacterized protein [Triticum aestivum]|uniref:uncharacterized protein isoform X2 n=1 Tax=Triticum aestivum TaxID=4565 RepID=UPI001D01AE98|nr:uncharacterized protein LOC123119965 isoform X2 [Triticum aestivum]
MRTGLAVEGGSPAGTAGARRQCRHGGRPTGRSSRSNCSRWSARRTASSAAARTVERGSCAVAGGEFSGRRLLSSSNPVPMRCSPRLDCSSFFAGGVLVRCSSLRVLDEHCRLSWFLPVVSCIDSRIFLPLPLRSTSVCLAGSTIC